jgi:hypothetical protein
MNWLKVIECFLMPLDLNECSSDMMMPNVFGCQSDTMVLNVTECLRNMQLWDVNMV